MIKKTIIDTYKHFDKEKGTLLAAASSFYLLLTIVPAFLLCLRMMGIFLSSMPALQDQIWTLANEFVPEAGTQLVGKVREVINVSLYAQKKWTVVNIVMLSISSISFFNSIGTGLYLMTKNRRTLKYRSVKSLVMVAISLFFLVGTLVFIPGLSWLFDLVGLPASWLPTLKFLTIPFSFLYLTFFYRWFFSPDPSFKNAGIGSVVFLLFFFLGKNLFAYYLKWSQASLTSQYGNHYILILGLFWVYYTMISFFIGASLIYTLDKSKRKKKLSI